MQLRGLDLQELEAQRAELLPDRIEMKRRKKKRPPLHSACAGAPVPLYFTRVCQM
jgi:hypothetical protein